jgi:hypothetical protein
VCAPVRDATWVSIDEPLNIVGLDVLSMEKPMEVMDCDEHFEAVAAR